jgi:hypothetical protein
MIPTSSVHNYLLYCWIARILRCCSKGGMGSIYTFCFIHSYLFIDSFIHLAQQTSKSSAYGAIASTDPAQDATLSSRHTKPTCSTNHHTIIQIRYTSGPTSRQPGNRTSRPESAWPWGAAGNILWYCCLGPCRSVLDVKRFSFSLLPAEYTVGG